MKKLSVLLVALFASLSVSQAQEWGAGARLGSGFQAVGQRALYNGNYLEARLGMDWIYGDITAAFSVLHVWRVNDDLNWTDQGRCFFDLGAGGVIGGSANYLVFGAQGLARLGYQFEDSPVSLSFDWSPSIGPEIVYLSRASLPGNAVPRGSISRFNARGLANFGVSCIYRF